MSIGLNEFTSWFDFDLPKRLRNNLIIFLFSGMMAIIGIITGVMVGDLGYDFAIYFRDIHNFFLKGNAFEESNFYYLSYFYYLYAWVLIFDLLPALLIHIGLTQLCLYYVLKNVDYENSHERNWLYFNIPIYLWFSVTFNVNLLILFSLMFYQNHREKWYSPFILFLGFYKINSIPVFFLLFFLNGIYDKKVNWKTLPALSVVFAIVTFSLFSSLGSITYNINEGIMVSLKPDNSILLSLLDGIMLSFSATHLIFLTYPLMIYTKRKDLSLRFVKRLWFLLFVIVILLSLLYFINNTNNMQERMIEYTRIIF